VNSQFELEMGLPSFGIMVAVGTKVFVAVGVGVFVGAGVSVGGMVAVDVGVGGIGVD
jgi:hypothetical protein